MKLVFVSSTFKDMQFERDLLQTYAIPTLDDALRCYGERAYFADLRWGVNTTDLDSDEGSRKVLKVCLDQIDNCKPYMIVLIGERYGWIPAQKLIDEACVLKGIDKIRDISVTELEIDYGALLDPDYEGRILFYFRNLDKTGMTDAQRRDYEAESGIHLEKVEELKRRIRQIYPDQIRYYDALWDPESQKVVGLEGFLAQVEADLRNALLRDLEAQQQRPWQERTMEAAARWFREESRNSSDVNNGRYRYAGSCTQEGTAFFLVTGPRCIGKTDWIAGNYCDQDGEKLAFIFGLDQHSRTAEDLAAVWLYKLEQMAGTPHQELDLLDTVDRIIELQQQTDALLHLYIDNGHWEFLSLLTRVEQACRDAQVDQPHVFLMAAVQAELPYYPCFRHCRLVEIGELSREDADRVLDDIVRSHHKELPEVVKDHIRSKQQSCHPAYLKSIVKRLMILDSEDFAAIRAMGDGMDNINRYMISIIDATADDREDILLELIDEAKDRLDREFVDRLMGLFASVPVALEASEIRDLFAALGWPFTDLQFSLAAKMLEDVVQPDPVSHCYKLRDPAIADKLLKDLADFPIQQVAEYMLGNDTLRPYAFRAAIRCDDPQFQYSVLKRSGVEDITDAIRYLVVRDEKQKAIDLLVHIAAQEELWYVELLPAVSTFRCDGDRQERVKALCFLMDLADRCEELLTTESAMLLELDLKARILGAEYMIEVNTKNAIDLLVNADSILRQYATQVTTDVYYGLYLTMLRAVSFSGSQQLYETYVEGEHYLRLFRNDDLEKDPLLRLRVYWEFSRAAELMDWELAETYRAKAKQIVAESEDLLVRCKEADFVILAELMEDMDYLLMGKMFYPLSENLLRQEIRLRLSLDADTDAVYDTLQMARAFLYHSANRTDSVQLLFAMLVYMVEADEIDVSLIDEYVKVMVFGLQHGLPRRNYAELIPFAECLMEYGEDHRLPEILKRCHWDDPFARIVRGYIRHRFIKFNKLKLLGLLRSYRQQRPDWLGTDRVAVAFLDQYFENIGMKVV